MLLEIAGTGRGYEKLTVTNAVKTLTDSKYNINNRPAVENAVLSIQGDAINFTVDGTTPSATEGTRLAAGDTLVLRGNSLLRTLKMFRVTTDSTVYVTYF